MRLDEFFDSFDKHVKEHRFAGIEVVEVEESIYRLVMAFAQDDDYFPNDIYDLRKTIDTIYCHTLLLKPVADGSIREGRKFKGTDLKVKDLTGIDLHAKIKFN